MSAHDNASNASASGLDPKRGMIAWTRLKFIFRHGYVRAEEGICSDFSLTEKIARPPSIHLTPREDSLREIQIFVRIFNTLNPGVHNSDRNG